MYTNLGLIQKLDYDMIKLYDKLGQGVFHVNYQIVRKATDVNVQRGFTREKYKL